MEPSQLAAKIIDEIRDKEEELIKTVLRNYLNREPTLDDAKRCAKVKGPDPRSLNYIFAIDGEPLGHVLFDHENYKIKFEPGQRFKQ